MSDCQVEKRRFGREGVSSAHVFGRRAKKRSEPEKLTQFTPLVITVVNDAAIESPARLARRNRVLPLSPPHPIQLLFEAGTSKRRLASAAGEEGMQLQA